MTEIDQAKQFVIDDSKFNRNVHLAEFLLKPLHFYVINDTWVVLLASAQHGMFWEVTYNETKKEAVICTYHQVDISTVYN